MPPNRRARLFSGHPLQPGARRPPGRDQEMLPGNGVVLPLPRPISVGHQVVFPVTNIDGERTDRGARSCPSLGSWLGAGRLLGPHRAVLQRRTVRSRAMASSAVDEPDQPLHRSRGRHWIRLDLTTAR